MNQTDLSELFPGRLKLTNSEYTVFCLVGEGKGNFEIARDLSLSPKTVAAHRHNLQNKLGLNARETMVAAVRWLMQGENP